MIDIDASLQAIESRSTFWVEFKDPGFDGENPAFEIKADPTPQRRLVNRSIKISAHMGKTEENNMGIEADWIGLASSLCDYIVGWRGFVGEFSRDKVKKWLSKYPSYAVAFAQSFQDILNAYEKDLIKRKDIEIKN